MSPAGFVMHTADGAHSRSVRRFESEARRRSPWPGRRASPIPRGSRPVSASLHSALAVPKSSRSNTRSIPCGMAGGMGRKGDRASLHKRIHGTPPSREPRVKHCWVTDRQGRLPGLLLEWRRTASGWQGHVVRPALEAGEWIVVEEWLPAELLDQGRSRLSEPFPTEAANHRLVHDTQPSRISGLEALWPVACRRLSG